jgi:hypothetical protein
MRQLGISPKVLGQALTTIAVWVLGYFAIQLPPEIVSAVALVIGAGAGYALPPGAVVHDHPTEASDELLDPEVQAAIAATPPPPG